jgi:hypothetical protein
VALRDVDLVAAVFWSDNALKPLLMGHGLFTPVLVISMGVLGGTLAHGIVGLFIGPGHPGGRLGTADGLEPR